MDLRSVAARARALCHLKVWAAEQNLGGSGKDELVQQLAEQLGINYGELLRRRLLHLMKPDEIAELAARGVDFQLHTHRHRMPLDQDLLWEELKQNRCRIADWTGARLRIISVFRAGFGTLVNCRGCSSGACGAPRPASQV